MTTSLKLASVAFKAALLVVLLAGLGMIWVEPGNITPGVRWRIMGVLRSIMESSLLVTLVSGLHIAVCAALAHIQRSSKHTSNGPSDE